MGSKSVVISRATIIITHIKGLITPLIATHEPSSRCAAKGPPGASAAPCSRACSEALSEFFKSEDKGLGLRAFRV